MKLAANQDYKLALIRLWTIYNFGIGIKPDLSLANDYKIRADKYGVTKREYDEKHPDLLRYIMTDGYKAAIERLGR